MVDDGEQVLDLGNLPPPPTTPESPGAFSPAGDHSDLLEDDDGDDDASGGFAGDALGGLPADAEGLDLGDLRATLGGAASGLAEQLQSITEEMNKIRSELYGDHGIGGIAKELEKLKSGSLGGILDKDALNGVLGGLDGLGGGLSDGGGQSSASREAPPRSGAAPRAAAPSSGGGGGGGGGGGTRAESEAAEAKSSASEARRRRGGEERNDSNGTGTRTREESEHLAALQRKFLEQKQRGKKESQAQVSLWEKLMLLFLVLVCLYACSPFFRSSVKRAVSIVVWGEDLEIDEESYDE